MLKKRPHAGFTIVEILIAIVIVGLLVSMAIPSYRVWIQNQQVRSATESILNGLQIARSEAVKSNMRVRFVLCGQAVVAGSGVPAGAIDTSWEVLAASATAVAPDAATSPSPACGAGSQGGANPVTPEIRVQERSGREGTRFAQVVTNSALVPTGTAVTSDGSNNVTFNGLGRVVANDNGGATVSTFEVSTPTSDRPLRVMIVPGGGARMCDPSTQLTANDPRRC